MRYQRTLRPVSVLFLLILLIGCGAVVALSIAPSTTSPGGSPFRLRLRVTKSTLQSGDQTSVWVEFLDRDHNKVQSDGTRKVYLEAASSHRRNPGSFAASELEVMRGDWSGATMFTAGDAGSVVLTVRSEGLDSDDTTLVVTQRSASWFSQLLGMFETVAYAQDASQFKFDKTEQSTSAGSAGEDRQLDFQLKSVPPPQVETNVKIWTEPTSKIKYNGKTDYSTNITFGPQNAVSSDISIISNQEGKVTVYASTDGGKPVQATANFTSPVAEKVMFKDEPSEIPAGDDNVTLTMQVVDDSGHPVKSGKERLFRFYTGNHRLPVEFRPPQVTLSAEQIFGVTQIILPKDSNELPDEIRVYVADSSDSQFTSPPKPIAVRGEVKSVKLDGDRTVQLGPSGAYFDVQLLDKHERPVSTDKERTVIVTASDGGTISPSPVVIPKGQSVKRVRYVASGSAGRAVINVSSEGIDGQTVPLKLEIALSLLVIVALASGLVGGLIRQISKNGYKLPRILPCWTGDCWDLGLVGHLTVSIVGGLIFYLFAKFGLYRLIGSVSLPEALDSGTKLMAFFFGVVGGFAGISLFNWLVAKLMPGSSEQAVPAA